MEQNPADNPSSPEATASEEIEKLIAKIGKVLDRLRDDTPEHELIVSLRSLFALFRSVNQKERDLLQPGESYEDLSLSRLFDLANSGSGGKEAEALREANAAFAEENTLLAETVESLAFQLETLRRKAADEIMERGDVAPIPLDAVATVLASVEAILSKIEAGSRILSQGNTANEKDSGGGTIQDAGLADRLFALLERYDVSTQELRGSSKQTTGLGRFLRRFGFSYDHKDVAAAHGVIKTLFQVNRDLIDLNKGLLPSQEQIARLRENLLSIERYLGHEGRQQPQYIEAMEEIERLRAKIERYVAAQGTLEALDKAIEGKHREIEALQVKEDALSVRIREREAQLREQEAKHRQEIEALRNKHFREIEKLTSEKEDLEERHQQEIASIQLMIRDIENGLLVQKLESEIGLLRARLDRAEKEREAQKAFEDRVRNWIPEAAEQQRKIGILQKTAGLKASFMVAATGGALLAGVGLGEALSDALSGDSLSAAAHFGVAAWAPAIFGGVIGVCFGNNGRSVINSFLVGGFFGMVSFVFGVLPDAQERVQERNRISEENRVLLARCEKAPCQLVRGADGRYEVVDFSKSEAGKKVTFDFTDSDNPRLMTERNSSSGTAGVPAEASPQVSRP